MDLLIFTVYGFSLYMTLDFLREPKVGTWDLDGEGDTTFTSVEVTD